MVAPAISALTALPRSESDLLHLCLRARGCLEAPAAICPFLAEIFSYVSCLLGLFPFRRVPATCFASCLAYLFMMRKNTRAHNFWSPHHMLRRLVQFQRALSLSLPSLERYVQAICRFCVSNTSPSQIHASISFPSRNLIPEAFSTPDRMIIH